MKSPLAWLLSLVARQPAEKTAQATPSPTAEPQSAPVREPAPGPLLLPTWHVIGKQHVGTGQYALRSKIEPSYALAYWSAKELSCDGFDVDVYLAAPCGAGEEFGALWLPEQTRGGRFEPAFGFRPGMEGAKAIGVG